MSDDETSRRPSVGPHHLSLLEQARKLIVVYLRDDRLPDDERELLGRLMSGTAFSQLPKTASSHLESPFYLLRTGMVVLQMSAEGRRGEALSTLMSGLETVKPYNGREDPFDGLLFALAASLARDQGEGELQEQFTQQVEWFAKQDEEMARLLHLVLAQLGSSAEDDAK